MKDKREIACIRAEATLSVPARALPDLNQAYGWSGQPEDTPPPALVEATYRLRAGQIIALWWVVFDDGSWDVHTEASLRVLREEQRKGLQAEAERALQRGRST